CTSTTITFVIIHTHHTLNPSSFFFLIIPPPPRSTLFPYTTLFRSLFPHVKLGNERVSYRLEWMLAVNEVPDAGPDFVQRVETVNLPDLPAYGDQDDLVGDSAGDEGGILVKDCAQRRHRHFLAPWPHRVKKGGCNLSVRRTDTG